MIDIRDVTFMSCRAILDMATRARQSELRTSVVIPVPSVTNRIIVAAGLTEWLPVYVSRTEAIAAAPTVPLQQSIRTTPPAVVDDDVGTVHSFATEFVRSGSNALALTIWSCPASTRCVAWGIAAANSRATCCMPGGFFSPTTIFTGTRMFSKRSTGGVPR